NAYHLEFTPGSHVLAKVPSEWLFISEKLPGKRLIDNRDMPRGRCILFGDAAPFDDRRPDNVKVSRCNSIPRIGVVVPRAWSRMTIYPYAGTPPPARRRV